MHRGEVCRSGPTPWCRCGGLLWCAGWGEVRWDVELYVCVSPSCVFSLLGLLLCDFVLTSPVVSCSCTAGG